MYLFYVETMVLLGGIFYGGIVVQPKGNKIVKEEAQKIKDRCLEVIHSECGLYNNASYKEIFGQLTFNLQVLFGAYNLKKCYHILDLPYQSDMSALEKRVRFLSLHFHPDKGEQGQDTQEIFRLINSAKDIITLHNTKFDLEKNPNLVEELCRTHSSILANDEYPSFHYYFLKPEFLSSPIIKYIDFNKKSFFKFLFFYNMKDIAVQSAELLYAYDAGQIAKNLKFFYAKYKLTDQRRELIKEAHDYFEYCSKFGAIASLILCILFARITACFGYPLYSRAKQLTVSVTAKSIASTAVLSMFTLAFCIVTLVFFLGIMRNAYRSVVLSFTPPQPEEELDQEQTAGVDGQSLENHNDAATIYENGDATMQFPDAQVPTGFTADTATTAQRKADGCKL